MDELDSGYFEPSGLSPEEIAARIRAALLSRFPQDTFALDEIHNFWPTPPADCPTRREVKRLWDDPAKALCDNSPYLRKLATVLPGLDWLTLKKPQQGHTTETPLPEPIPSRAEKKKKEKKPRAPRPRKPRTTSEEQDAALRTPTERPQQSVAILLNTRLPRIGVETTLLSQEETNQLFTAIDDLRDQMIPLLCLIPSALASLHAMHKDEKYLSRIITYKKTADSDEGDATEQEDTDDQTDETDTAKPAKQVKSKQTSAKNRPEADKIRAQIAEQSAALLSLIDAAAPDAAVAACRRELSGLLKLQPPRDSCLMQLVEGTAQDARRAPNTYGDVYAQLTKLRRGIIATKDKVRRHNMRMAIHYANKRRFNGIEYDAMVTEGAIGLLRAIESFDQTKGINFAGYAANWVKAMIDDCIGRESGLILPGRRTHYYRRKLYAISQLFKEENGREPNNEELAALSDLTQEQIAQINDQSTSRVVSLDTPVIPADSSSASLGDLIPDQQSTNAIVDHTHTYQLRNLLTRTMIEVLKPREEYILRLRLGLPPNEAMTLEEVSRIVNVTRERVRQIEARALERLRNSPRLCGASIEL